MAGFIIRDESPVASNWRSQGTLRDYLVSNNIVAISDIDTRELTRKLRSGGVMRGVVATGHQLDEHALVERARSIPKMEGSDLVRGVTSPRPPSTGRRKIPTSSTSSWSAGRSAASRWPPTTSA